MIEVLCRRSKRNPVLLGPAGSGKTAIVEGLAERIAAGRVPALWQGTRLIEVPLSSIVAGTQYRGQLEERLVHLVAGGGEPPGIVPSSTRSTCSPARGQRRQRMGADQVLKPALARGDIAVIGATTPEEYRASIERDDALARRFTTIDVRELDAAATRPILRALRTGLLKARGVRVSDAALDVLLAFADQRILNRRFPDKAIDLLEQAVARALVAGRTSVSRADAVRTTEVWASRASSTPTLDRFGRDLVRLAHEGKLEAIVGRDRELRTVQRSCSATRSGIRSCSGRRARARPRSSKDSPVGSRAATFPCRCAAFGCKRSHCSNSRRPSGDPSRAADFFLEARHPSVVVFFDEVHLLASPTVSDLAESLKPLPGAWRNRVHRGDHWRGIPGAPRAGGRARPTVHPGPGPADGCGGGAGGPRLGPRLPRAGAFTSRMTRSMT